MRQIKTTVVLLLCAGTLFTACKKDSQKTTQPDEISQDVRTKIDAMGLDGSWVSKFNNGYLVEGDIFVSESQLNEAVAASPILRVANSEQYRTFNLVTALPRVITVSVTNLPTVYSNATIDAIARYNNLGLQITFQKVQSGGNIDIIGFNQGPSGGYITLGSSGFPSNGNPYNQIMMNTNAQAYGTNPDQSYVASVIQHEIGHCIGFRHTDYMNRSYSCGGRKVNEGQAKNGVGAVLIPGTPSGPDANSWMLACSNGGNRTFNVNDVTALNYLY